MKLYAPFRLDAATQTEGDVLVIPEIDGPGSDSSEYRVILYNDDLHSFDEVIVQVIKATECTPQRAAEIMLEAHSKGRAVCYRGTREKCHKVTRILREINLQCEVDCD